MKPVSHLIASTIATAVVGAATRSLPAAGATLAAGVLIDLDHVVDYLREYGLRIDPDHFFTTFSTTRFQRLYLVLHAWEWMAALAGAAWLTGWNPWITGTFLGATLHLSMDQWRNRVRPWGYFITWRWRKGFPGSGLLREEVERLKSRMPG